MKVLIIGNGGREHAMAWKIAQSPKLTKLYAAPGNAGIAEVAELVDIPAKNQEALLKFCKEHEINLVIVGPEAPLVEGIVDKFAAQGIRVFGPSQYAAQLEGSKVFSKELMRKLNIPTGEFQVFDNAEAAMNYIAEKKTPIVIKVDGLAGGKGVTVATSMPKAMEAIHLYMVKKVFGKAGDRVVIEECLEGDEASVIAITDGETVKLLASSQDHKRIFEGDTGPNTGGMGAYSPTPAISAKDENEILERVFKPLVAEFKAQGHPYKGFLYAGIMMTGKGYRVLEFNARLGDPETQVILPRMENDFLELIDLATVGRLQDAPLQWLDEDCVCVVVAAQGYPENYETGKKISGLSIAKENSDIQIFHAGTKLENNQVVTAGGRVLNVVGWSTRGIFEALSKCYAAVDKIYFDKMYFRKDIGHKATKISK